MIDPESPDAVSVILTELRDINKGRRRTAVIKLGMLGGDQAVRTLMDIVENHQEDLIVRGRAALMLGKLRDDRAVTALIRALDAPGFQTPHNAAIALGKIGDPRAINALLNLADSSRDKTREAALQALRELGYEFERPLYADAQPEI
jgi:HEAT repeat protein